VSVEGYRTDVTFGSGRRPVPGEEP
jgi:hypothetical protein